MRTLKIPRRCKKGNLPKTITNNNNNSNTITATTNNNNSNNNTTSNKKPLSARIIK